VPNRAVVLELSDADEDLLRERVRAKSLPAREIERARIVLLASDGIPADEIARRVGCSRPTVVLWRSRYASAGIDGLVDDPRSGGPKRLPHGIEERIVAKTLKPPPKRLGVTHWSSRLLAREIGCSYVFITKVWKAHGLKPHRTQTFKFSTDPELETKIEDIVGLYLFPPENAIVFCVDEKSQIQALERTQPILPLRPDCLHEPPTTIAATEPRHCSPLLRLQPARSPIAASTNIDTKSSSRSSSKSLLPTLVVSFTSSVTTTAPINIRWSTHGWGGIPGSICTSRRRVRAGSTWWRRSSRSSRVRRSVEDHSVR
jgi:transposase